MAHTLDCICYQGDASVFLKKTEQPWLIVYSILVVGTYFAIYSTFINILHISNNYTHNGFNTKDLTVKENRLLAKKKKKKKTRTSSNEPQHFNMLLLLLN